MDRCSGTVLGVRCPLLFVVLGLSLLLPAENKEIIGVDLGDGGDVGSKQSDEMDTGVASLFDPLLRLNRYTFHKTIMEEHLSEVPHWIVLFCPTWYEPCQALQPIYRQLAERWQEQLNDSLLSTQVRFASVDCATEKALCNTQKAGMEYPYIGHYHHHQLAATWRGKSYETDEKRLRTWLQKRLGKLAAAARTSLDEDIPSNGESSIPVDFLLVFAAIVGNAWFISRASPGAEASTGCSKGGAPSSSLRATSSGSPTAEQQPTCVYRPARNEATEERQPFEL